jgi:hypothetical protein
MSILPSSLELHYDGNISIVPDPFQPKVMRGLRCLPSWTISLPTMLRTPTIRAGATFSFKEVAEPSNTTKALELTPL